MNSENNTHVGTGLKLAMIAVVLFMVLVLVGMNFLPMLQTVGGSFGYGYPGASGGRAIRDVVIDVEPQVVYRIDENRFFTLENYLDCNRGGFVYYNDINKKLKVLAGGQGLDKIPQNEVSVMEKNHVLSFYGRFIYAASPNVIAFPYRNVSYKYGNSTYFVISRKFTGQSGGFGSDDISPGDTVFITDDAIYVKNNTPDRFVKKITADDDQGIHSEWVDIADFKVNRVSQDEYFHCDNRIKPRNIKYIK